MLALMDSQQYVVLKQERKLANGIYLTHASSLLLLAAKQACSRGVRLNTLSVCTKLI